MTDDTARREAFFNAKTNKVCQESRPGQFFRVEKHNPTCYLQNIEKYAKLQRALLKKMIITVGHKLCDKTCIPSLLQQHTRNTVFRKTVFRSRSRSNIRIQFFEKLYSEFAAGAILEYSFFEKHVFRLCCGSKIGIQFFEKLYSIILQ